AAASIAGTPVMQTSMAAFRVALVGFTLPFIFVYRPQLLLLDPATGALAPLMTVVWPLVVAMLGIAAFAAGLAGYLVRPMPVPMRALAFAAAGLLLAPGPEIAIAGFAVPIVDVMGLAAFAAMLGLNLVMTRAPDPPVARAPS
ncbi:MAG TPA: hypothetical protein VMS86_15580, partial [Thermoanaerobaculia bacterium]|nr:hypothetical protein [Thermoanaerobaculia bacterium]